jgi:4'-phosphopantetheinyl transferase EntD
VLSGREILEPFVQMEEGRVRSFDEGEAAHISDQLAILASFANAELLTGCRVLQLADEFKLFPCESVALRNAASVVRRRSGTARVVARSLLRGLGSSSLELPRASSGAPRWPKGFVGSLSHDSDFAVAAVAIQRSMNSVGIDIEPNSPLRPELLDLVASPAERAQLGGDLLSARLLFSIKEAVYKATHPLDGQFLDYTDVEVDLDKLSARTVTGHNLRVFAVTQPRILTLTTVPR